MRIEDLDFELPEELVAQRPAAHREDARLLVVERDSGSLHDSRIAAIGEWLRPGDALVVNETRVRPARLDVHRASGGRVELLLVRPETGDGECWRVLAKPARHAAVGARLTTADTTLEFEVVASGDHGERTLRVVSGDLARQLARQGAIPLPPYIRRAPDDADRERYQTVYARVDGAVASPTAGLHFSDALLARLQAAGIERVPVLLHVGPGTFRPVSAADPREHRMDEEWFEVSDEAAARLQRVRDAGGRIVAVGTTSVRALESACDAHDGRLEAACGWTRKFILPPYRFRGVDALLTNFHLPRTTLLLLVGALAGQDCLKAAYAHAVAQRYRFYSYGDAMLVV